MSAIHASVKVMVKLWAPEIECNGIFVQPDTQKLVFP